MRVDTISVDVVVYMTVHSPRPVRHPCQMTRLQLCHSGAHFTNSKTLFSGAYDAPWLS